MSFLRKAAKSRPLEPTRADKQSLLARTRRAPHRPSLADRATQVEAVPEDPAASGSAPEVAGIPAPVSDGPAPSITATELAAGVLECAEPGLSGPLAGAHLTRCLVDRLPGASLVAFAAETRGGPLTPLAAGGPQHAVLAGSQIDPESAVLAPGSMLAEVGAAVLDSPEQHSTHAPLFPTVDTRQHGEWGLLSLARDRVVSLLVAIWGPTTLSFEPRCSEPVQAALAAIASAVGQAMDDGNGAIHMRSDDVALRKGPTDLTDSAATRAVRFDASPLVHHICRHLSVARPMQVLRRVQLAAATALGRLGQLAATAQGVVLAPRLPLDVELVHRRVAYALRGIAVGVAGTDGAALLELTRLESAT